MELELKYGSGTLTLTLPSHTAVLSHTEPSIEDPFTGFQQGIRSHLQGLTGKPGNVGIVVSDKTRLCQYPEYLPGLTGTLSEFGLSGHQVTFYIAYGTHARQTEEECLLAYGETYRRFSFVHHDSRADERLVSMGVTSRGTEVRVLKEVLNHDLLISFGALSHHYIAGFGGGRKLLFPGLGGYKAVLQNHRLFLDFRNRKLVEECRSGNLEDNPMALDLEEISRMMPERLEIHAILNSRGKVCELLFGNVYDNFRAACHRYDHFFRSVDKDSYDMVVAGSGGYPKDINFIQAHKSIHNAASFVKDDGTLIIFAECRDKIGNPSFHELFMPGGMDELFEKMEVRYENNAGTALAMMTKTRRIKIHFVTSLDELSCDLLGATRTSAAEAQKSIDQEKGKIAFIENASLLYK